MSFLLPFVRSAEPFIFIRFWAPFFDQNRKKGNLQLLGAKMGISIFSASGRLLPPKAHQNAKVGPKVKKAVLGVLGSKNVPRPLRFSMFCARSENDAFSSFALFALFRFLGAKAVFGLQKWSKPPKTLKIRLFALFCENGLQNT